MKTKTFLTKKQVRAYLLVSGQFQGYSTKIAAELMGISVQALNRLLKRAEKVCPQIFPIMTKQEAEVQKLLVNEYSHYDIANKLGVSLSRVSQIIGSIAEKRGVIHSQPVKMLRYAPFMDSEIQRKF